MTRPIPIAAVGRLDAAASRTIRATRWLATLCLATNLAGCVLTQDIPDPALDIPGAYKAAGRVDFEWPAKARLVARIRLVGIDLADGRGPAGQPRHRRRGRAVQTGRCPGASGRRRLAAESLRQWAGNLFADVRRELERAEHRWPRNGELYGFAQRVLPARFLGAESRCPAGGRRNRDRRPLRSRRRRAHHAGQRGQCLFPGAGFAGPDPHRRAQHRQRHARPRRHQGAKGCRHRD